MDARFLEARCHKEIQMTRTTTATLVVLSLAVLSFTTGCGHGNSRIAFELGHPEQLQRWAAEHDAKASLAGQTQTGAPAATAPPQGETQPIDPLQQAGIVYRDASLAASAAVEMIEYAMRPMMWASDPTLTSDLTLFGAVSGDLADGLGDIEKSMKEDEPWDQLEKLKDGMATLRTVAKRLDRELSRREEFEAIRSRIPDQFRIVDEMMAEWGMHVSYVYSEVKHYDDSPSAWSVAASFVTGHDFGGARAAAHRFRAPSVIRPVPPNCYQRFSSMACGGYRGFDAQSLCRSFTGVSVFVGHDNGGTAVGVDVNVRR